ncbi:MAG: dihydroorotate dehydrogenase [Planctomycetes bacterium]|nr:dihydroorotate dehydrogenase [Planctomycetota bacterium]
MAAEAPPTEMAFAPPPILNTSISSLSLASPLIAAAGTAGVVDELADIMDPGVLGAIVTKSITPEAREGNDPWRLVETEAGILNAIGLANPGLKKFQSDYAPKAAKLPCAVVGSAAGHTVADFVAVARGLIECGMAAVELNVSCPNTATGRHHGGDPVSLTALIREVRPAVPKGRLWIKLPPDGPTLALAAAAVEAGADALTLCNTFPAMKIDPVSRKPVLSRGQGGLSGPAIHPIVVRLVYEVYRNVAKSAGVPIIGLGGVLSWKDAAELIVAGASAVGLGTAFFVDPGLPMKISKGLALWAAQLGVSSFGELVGSAQQA